MLSPEEFSVGDFKKAKPGSLVLPRTKYEALALICEGDGEPIAVFLAGNHAFQSFPSGEADNWNGVVVPDVRIEIDETSLYDPDQNGHALGILVREETKLVVRSKAEHSFGRSVPVVIQLGLPDCKGSAAFTRWQVVIGRGEEASLPRHARARRDPAWVSSSKRRTQLSFQYPPLAERRGCGRHSRRKLYR